jgi:hypothetical protein
MFIIDRKAGTAVVLHFEKETGEDGVLRYWGALDAIGPDQRAAIEGWLDSRGLDLSDAVPGAD